MEMTLAIVKPDSVKAGNTGKILAHLGERGFAIRGLRMLHLTEAQAQAFYEVHQERPFFGELVEFMTSGPVVPVALERDNAVAYLREVMGATDSRKAAPGRSASSRHRRPVQRDPRQRLAGQRGQGAGVLLLARQHMRSSQRRAQDGWKRSRLSRSPGGDSEADPGAAAPPAGPEAASHRIRESHRADPVGRARELRGFLRGIDTTVERESDRL